MKCLVITCVSIINVYFSVLLSSMVEFKLEKTGLNATSVNRLRPADVGFPKLNETRQAIFDSAMLSSVNFIVKK